MAYNKEIEEIKEYAERENVPIMQEDGIELLIKIINENNVKKILEVGTAIAYSTIRMALSKDIVIDTIERDEKRYLEAVKNIKKVELEKKIKPIFGDALDVKIEGKYDLIFLDAAKGKNIEFFEKFENNLNKNGIFVTDNMNFHGYVQMNENEIQSRNLRGLVRKIKKYREFLKTNPKYETTFYEIGDGVAVTRKKE